MGVKWRWNRGWRSSQRLISGVLWVDDVVDDEMDVEIVGHAAVDQVQEPAELLGPVALGHVGDDLTRSHVEGGVEVGGAVAHVVMGAPLGEPGPKRAGPGAVRSSAWTWVFSSTQSTRAPSGGLM